MGLRLQGQRTEVCASSLESSDSGLNFFRLQMYTLVLKGDFLEVLRLLTQATSLTTIKGLIPANDVTTFSLTSDKLGRTDVLEHDVNVGDAPPIRQQPYRVPLPM